MAAVKALQQWCRLRCDGYRDVAITNMTTSFRDGLAFCALIHKHRPDLIDFDSLRKDDVYENNKLAFRVAEEELGIPALLDAEDMVALKVPDRLSILTYVSQYYNYFHGRSPIGGLGGIKRPADVPSETPSGKKNQAVVSKVFPSKPSPPPSPKISRPSPKISRPSPSPRRSGTTTKNSAADKSPQTGTLSNKCVSCHQLVHLVQRHLVDGKLYHRHCAKSLSPANSSTLFRGLPINPPAPRPSDSSRAAITAPTNTPSRLGPSWLPEKPRPLPSSSSSSSSSFSPPSAAKETPVVLKPVSPRTPVTTATVTTATASISTTPTPAPRSSSTAAKTQQTKLRFFTSDNNAEKKTTTTANFVVNKSSDVTEKTAKTTAVNQPVTVVLNVGGLGRKEADVGGAKAAKATAAAFISKKLTEENNNNNKPNNNNNKPNNNNNKPNNNKPAAWSHVELKKTDKSPQPETPVKEVGGVRGEVGGVRGRKLLKVDRSVLSDLDVSGDVRTPSPTRSPTRRNGGVTKPHSVSPNITVSENESPADWRSKLKPVSKAAAPTPSSPKPWTRGGVKTSESVGPPPSSQPPAISVTPPAAKGLLNGQKDSAANGTKSEKVAKTKPDYILKEDILKELQDIEDNLNAWEQRGVELEVKLRSSEDEGEDDSVMDELMVEWFNLIRNKQVAMRRESELVYIGKTQDLEEEQPSVEKELRRLMEKPDHLKSAWDRQREDQLMAKLMEIVNDRNAIVEGLDEDRLREEEEDEELNKMMMNFSLKKDKVKKKNPMSKLFGLGKKKDG